MEVEAERGAQPASHRADVPWADGVGEVLSYGHPPFSPLLAPPFECGGGGSDPGLAHCSLDPYPYDGPYQRRRRPTGNLMLQIDPQRRMG
jgi:hypothetical protein